MARIEFAISSLLRVGDGDDRGEDLSDDMADDVDSAAAVVVSDTLDSCLFDVPYRKVARAPFAGSNDVASSVSLLPLVSPLLLDAAATLDELALVSEEI